jgi:DNA-binding PadR family transcriptional regulator
MSLLRLVSLGLLAKLGPLHGHHLRREAEAGHLESWSGVSAGALYRELPCLAADGLIELLHSEQVGRRPARAVFRGHCCIERELAWNRWGSCLGRE